MPWKPDVTVAAVIESGERYLVVEERISQRLVFNQPAGHVESGETLLEAVIREVREETAWRFEPQALLGVYQWQKPASSRSILRFAFIGTASDHDPAQPLDRGIVRTHWLTHAELLDRQARLRSPLVMRCIDDYRAGKRFSLDAVAFLDIDTAKQVRAIPV